MRPCVAAKVLPNFALAATPAHSAIVPSSLDQIGLQEAGRSRMQRRQHRIALLVSRAIPPHVNKLPG